MACHELTPPVHLSGLTDEQYIAIRSTSDRLFISAGPGSGKTRVLTSRFFERIILPMTQPVVGSDMMGVEPPEKKSIEAWVLTFTNKAAEELRERLVELSKRSGRTLERDFSSSLFYIGTFHSLSYQLLLKYGKKYLGLKRFNILDVADANTMVRAIVKQLQEELAEAKKNDAAFASDLDSKVLDQSQINQFLSIVSAHKQSYRQPSNSPISIGDPWGFYSVDHFTQIAQSRLEDSSGSRQFMQHDQKRQLATYTEVYKRYTSMMRQACQLDFDDLIQWAILLINQQSPDSSGLAVKEIFVDEFQDTNYLQLEFLAAVYHHCSPKLTVVGDFDQAIFGWRNFAEVKLKKDCRADQATANTSGWRLFTEKDPLPTTKNGWEVVHLTANFRSVVMINEISHLVIKFDSTRALRDLPAPYKMAKTVPPWVLNSQNIIKERGSKIYMNGFSNLDSEAAFIVGEIGRLKYQASRNRIHLPFNSIAILMRTGFNAKTITQALAAANIPTSGLGRPGLWDTKAVRDILSYVRLLYNPSDITALMRAINVPPRKVGPASILKLTNFVSHSTQPALEALLELYAPGKPSFTPQQTDASRAILNIKGIKNFVQDMQSIRDRIMFSQPRLNLVELLEIILTTAQIPTNPSTIEDKGASSVNPVDGLRELASAIQQQFPGSSLDFGEGNEHRDEKAETNEAVPFKLSIKLDKMVAGLLESAGLGHSSDSSKRGSGGSDSVKITTLHSSKGLEWPIVFIIGMNEGTLPYYRCKTQQEIAEEARLLYVGVTRCQYQLYVTWLTNRFTQGSDMGSWGSLANSPFLDDIPKPLQSKVHPKLDSEMYWVGYQAMVPNCEITSISTQNKGPSQLIPAEERQSQPIVIDLDEVYADKSTNASPESLGLKGVKGEIIQDLTSKCKANSKKPKLSHTSDSDKDAKAKDLPTYSLINQGRLGGGGFISARELFKKNNSK